MISCLIFKNIILIRHSDIIALYHTHYKTCAIRAAIDYRYRYVYEIDCYDTKRVPIFLKIYFIIYIM